MTASVVDSLLPLPATERCQKGSCGARAVVEVVVVREPATIEGEKGAELVTKTYDLMFCAHDYLANAKALAEQATKIIRHPIPD